MSNVIRSSTILCLSALLLASPLRAQEEKFRERQVLDPDTDEWVDRAVEGGTPAGELEQARSLLATGEAAKARRMLRKWVDANASHERYYEGVFLLGESYFETRDFYKAFEAYLEVSQNTGGDLFQRSIRREVDVARAFLAGEKRIVWRIFRLPAYDDGVTILNRVWEQAPGTRTGEQALKLKADYHFDNGEMEIAQDEYVSLAKEYPSGRYVRPAMLRSAEAAQAAFPGIRFDDRALIDADERFRQVRATFPAYAERENVDARIEGVRQLRAEKDLDIAKWYEKTRQPGAAEFYYRRLMRDWPGTLAEAEAKSRLRALGVAVEAPDSPPAELPARQGEP
jgi:tetratricopeptide (TPR) repeat protein